jgi:polyvinyl alcohol dehydrogenase (cytochrome)
MGESAMTGSGMLRGLMVLAAAAGWAAVAASSLSAASPVAVSADVLAPRKANPAFSAGQRIFQEHCASCHESGASRAPLLSFLQDFAPQSVYRALTEGVMRPQGAQLSDRERVSVAEYVTNRRLSATPAVATRSCTGEAARFDVDAPPAFAGWGFDLGSTHAVSATAAGITAADLPRLKLKWAFGFPDAERVRSQPALAGGAILIGSHNGSVYALDAKSGCVRWQFQAGAEVRSAIVVSSWQKGDHAARPLAYFGDVGGSVYAVEAFTGKLIWTVKADDHPDAVITAAPALYAGTLYVPVSSLEEASAAAPGYVCCTFRGSLLALDARSGAQKWRTWLLPPAQATGPATGPQSFGPSGIAVWNTPAIDAKRGQLTIGTGDNYTQPATPLSDSIVALDLVTGQIRWHHQAREGDAWNVGCMIAGSTSCPRDAGPDFDFGAGTVLGRDAHGRELVIAGQKSGLAYAVDPDSGKLVWRTRVGRGGAGGGTVFGLAVADGRAFFPVSDLFDGQPSAFPLSPGLHAVDLASGAIAWHAAAPGDCAGKSPCGAGYTGSVTVAGQLALVGADDAHIRIYEQTTGKLLWDFDTARSFATVNGVAAHGGAIGGGAAPVVWGGQLIVASGYGFANKMPGNVLLVFGVE